MSHLCVKVEEAEDFCSFWHFVAASSNRSASWYNHVRTYINIANGNTSSHICGCRIGLWGGVVVVSVCWKSTNGVFLGLQNCASLARCTRANVRAKPNVIN